MRHRGEGTGLGAAGAAAPPGRSAASPVGTRTTRLPSTARPTAMSGTWSTQPKIAAHPVADEGGSGHAHHAGDDRNRGEDPGTAEPPARPRRVIGTGAVSIGRARGRPGVRRSHHRRGWIIVRHGTDRTGPDTHGWQPGADGSAGTRRRDAVYGDNVKDRFDAVVIGSGPNGLVAALDAGEPGMEGARRRGRAHDRRGRPHRRVDPAGIPPRHVLGDPSARPGIAPRCAISTSNRSGSGGSIPTLRSVTRSGPTMR